MVVVEVVVVVMVIVVVVEVEVEVVVVGGGGQWCSITFKMSYVFTPYHPLAFFYPWYSLDIPPTFTPLVTTATTTVMSAV